VSDIFHAGISGARGRMGRAVSQVLDAREDVVVAARFDRGETVDLKLCDVIIDFSTPEASVALARACAEADGPALVIGSTGLSPEQLAEIEVAADKIAIVMSGNFSLGVNILIGLVEHAALRLDARDWDIEVLETHHRRKVDAPSGTALMLGEAGYTADSIDTTADVSLDKVDAGFAITKIALKSEVAVPGIDASTFDGIIQKAKAGCPVSQVLKAEITLDYQLKS